jgi:hypothetical protein
LPTKNKIQNPVPLDGNRRILFSRIAKYVPGRIVKTKRGFGFQANENAMKVMTAERNKQPATTISRTPTLVIAPYLPSPSPNESSSAGASQRLGVRWNEGFAVVTSSP